MAETVGRSSTGTPRGGRRGGRGSDFRPDLHTSPRRDAFESTLQDRTTYYTTQQMSKELGIDYQTVHRWCQRWYGQLPPARRGKGMGYRIHPFMVKVARGWLQTQDMEIREAIFRAIEKSPRDWVVVVGNLGSGHYTAAEAQGRVAQVLELAMRKKQPISVLYVGDPKERAA